MSDIRAVGALADLAEGQAGFLTTRQASLAGVDDLSDLIAARVVEPVTDGVVRLRGGAQHPLPRLYAAWLALEPEVAAWQRTVPDSGVVSHHSAVRLYRLGDLPGPHPFFTVAPSSPAAAHANVRRATLDDTQWRMLEDLPVTTPARTLSDLATGHLDLEDLRTLVRGFIDGGWATAAQLAAGLSLAGPDAGDPATLQELLSWLHREPAA